MTTLLLKDLRLSLDALRPWALIVAGFAVSMFAFSYLPTTIVPRSLQGLSVGELLNLVGLLVGASAIAVSAWAVSAVVQGDRKRGALSLALVVPKSGMRIVGSKLFAIFLAVLTPLVVAVTLQLSGSAMMGTTLRAPGNALLIPPIVALAVFVGAAFALMVAPLVRGTFAAVTIALLFGVVAAACGWLGEQLSFWIVARDYLRTAAEVGSNLEVDTLDGHALWFAGIVGIIAASAGCLVVGTLALLRPRSRRFMVQGGAGSLACAVIAGIVATAVVVPRDPLIGIWHAHWRSVAARASDAEIAAAVPRWMGTDAGKAAAWPRSTQSQMDAALVQEGGERVRSIPIAARDSSVIADAFRRAEDYRRLDKAAVSLWYLVPRDDPRRLGILLDCVLRYPSNVNMRRQLLECMAGRGIEIDWPQVNVTDRESNRICGERVDEAGAAALRRLVEAGDPQSELMRRVIDVLHTPREDDWRGP